jgi:hypothetical protein
MDYTIIYALCVLAGTILLIFGIDLLYKKNIITKEVMALSATILGIAIEVLKELKIKDPLIVKISEIVKDSVNLAVNGYDNPDEIANLAFQFCIDKCAKLGIEITFEREIIINDLIILVLKNR